MEEIAIRCPVFANWSMRMDGSCKRYHMCDEVQQKLCGAHPTGEKVTKPYSKSKSCPCKYTSMIPTDDTVMVGGQQKRIYLVVCRECGSQRRTII